MAQIEVLQGRLVESLERSREIVRTGEDAGDHQSWAWGSNALGTVLWRVGAPEEGARCLNEAIAVFEGIPDHGSVASASGDLAHCYLLQGKVEEAIALLEVTDRLISERKIHGFNCTEPRLAMAKASLLAAEQAGEGERAALLKKAKQACKLARKQAKLDRQALPAACRFQGVYHWLQGDAGKARTWWRKSIEAAEQLEARYEIGMTSLELGRRAGDPEQLARGEALLREISAARQTHVPAEGAPADALAGATGP